MAGADFYPIPPNEEHLRCSIYGLGPIETETSLSYSNTDAIQS